MSHDQQIAVELAGYLSSAVGVGEAARRYAHALGCAGASVQTHDVPLPGRDRVATRLESSFVIDAPIAFEIVCLNPEQMLPYLDDRQAPRPRRRTIGVWSWEVDVLPEGWREASRRLDEIWTYSSFAARLIGAGVETQVHSTPLPVWAPVAEKAPAIALPEGFRVLVIFDFLSTLERKNPLGALEAYKRAFEVDEGSVLVVKSVNGRHRPQQQAQIAAAAEGRPDIVLLDGTMPAAERDALISACDCFLSLHRSEGYGLPLAEAMAIGKPVLATAYGGNMEFMNERNSYLVSWSPALVGRGVEHYPAGASWAEPNIEHAAQLLREVRYDTKKARQRAASGREQIESRLHPRTIGTQMIDRLRALGTSRDRSLGLALTSACRDYGMRIVDWSGASVDIDRGSTVVCVPLTGLNDPQRDVEQVLSTIESLHEHPEALAHIVIVGRESTLRPFADQAEGCAPEGVLALQVADSERESEMLERLIEVCTPADIALVAPGVRVHSQWLQRLRAAALSDSVIASATAMFDADRAAAEAIAEASLALRPRIGRIGPHCALLRRQALELIGPSEIATNWSDALRQLSASLRALGMLHVAADDVAVELPRDLPVTHERSATPLGELDHTDEDSTAEDHGPLPRSLRLGGISRRTLTVTIDARSLTGAVGGTQTYVLGLVLSLARDSRVRLRALVPPDLSRHAAGVLAGVDVELITPEQAEAGSNRSDVAHRPQQISSSEDFAILRTVGERLVITHQDLIAYHNDAYHPDVETWLRHREITRAALAAADRVIFFSQHARSDAVSEDLLPPERAHVVGIGAEQLEPALEPASRPAGLTCQDRFMLCLGADYAHKNRPFAIRLLIELHALGWQGRLVFAGPHVPYGSSIRQEAELRNAHPQLKDLVVDLGAVEEGTKRWLLSHTRALIYPSVYEGFGLLPLEAARSRLPCLYAPQASLAELDVGTATIVPWDAAASAAAALPLLIDGPAREDHLASLAQLAVPSWSEVVERLLDVYRLAATGPRSSGALLNPELHLALLRHLRETADDLSYHRRLAQDYQDALHALEERVSVGLPLIDRGGLLSHAQQRGLMRVASRHPIGSLALAPFGLMGHLRAGKHDGS